MQNKNNPLGFSCPLPRETTASVQLGHGSGGKMTHRLIEDLFRPAFDNPWLAQEHDSAVLEIGGQRLAMTTDSYVVSPLFFPGGDIGKLAVYGTVNDLAMAGARPLYLSCAFIIEAGFPFEQLSRIAQSMQAAADEAGVHLVSADTKVVEHGKGDGLYINTSGIGQLEHAGNISPRCIAAGDLIILSGDIGRHGMALLAEREGLSFENPLQSDCAPLWQPVETLLENNIDLHCLRDLTRGGLATVLVELAESAGLSFRIGESHIAVKPEIQGACELLGLEPNYVASEGRFVLFVEQQDGPRALQLLRQQTLCQDAVVIGSVSETQEEGTPQVVCVNVLGSERLLERLPDEQLPRIC